MRQSKWTVSLFSATNEQVVRVFDWYPYVVVHSGSSIIGRSYPSDPPLPGETSADGDIHHINPSTSSGLSIDVQQYETKVSFSSPGWNGSPQKRTILYIPKSIKDPDRYFKAPTKPTYRAPNFSIPKTPPPLTRFSVKPNRNGKVTSKARLFEDRVNATRAAKHNKRVTEYERLLSLREKAFTEAGKRYELAYQKYLLRKKRYEARLSLLEAWNKPRKLRNQRKWPVSDNPFLRLSLTKLSSGPSISSYYYDSVGGTSPHVLNMISYAKLVSGSVTDSDVDQIADSLKDCVRAAMLPEIESLDAKLTRKLYSKLNSSSVNYAVMFAERAQTMDLFLSSVRRLSELIRLKRNLFKSLGRYLLNPKMIANDYLAFQFGVLPLLEDVYGTAKNLAELSVPGNDSRVVARTNSRIPVSFSRGGVTVDGFLTRSYVFKYSIDEFASAALENLGLVNPASVAWEVLPFSFVVDWFLPVGSYIDALTDDLGLSFDTGCISERFLGTVTIDPALVMPSFKDGTTRVLPSGTFALDYYERTPALPPDKFSIFKFKNPLSLTHGLESLALLVQKIL